MMHKGVARRGGLRELWAGAWPRENVPRCAKVLNWHGTCIARGENLGKTPSNADLGDTGKYSIENFAD